MVTNPDVRKAKLSLIAQNVLAALLIGSAVLLVVYFFEQLPLENTSLGIDWKTTYAVIQGGTLQYKFGVPYPPWAMIAVLPLGWLSFRQSWGMLVIGTIIILVVSVPRFRRKPVYWAGILLLCASFSSLRHIADGNLEGFIIASVLLILHGFVSKNWWVLGVGIILATLKIQETWLLLLTLAFYLMRSWPVRHWLTIGAGVAAVIVLSLIWKGADWWDSFAAFPTRNSIMDSSWIAASQRLGWPGWGTAVVWLIVAALVAWVIFTTGPSLSREKATLLLAGSMVLAPYAAGNSVLTILAIGVIPLLFTRPLVGIGLLILDNIPFFFTRDIAFAYSAYYWTALLGLTVVLTAMIVVQDHRRTASLS